MAKAGRYALGFLMLFGVFNRKPSLFPRPRAMP
jgi:hypothetical protein